MVLLHFCRRSNVSFDPVCGILDLDVDQRRISGACRLRAVASLKPERKTVARAKIPSAARADFRRAFEGDSSKMSPRCCSLTDKEIVDGRVWKQEFDTREVQGSRPLLDAWSLSRPWRFVSSTVLQTCAIREGAAAPRRDAVPVLE